ncbi:hypothetical protein LTR85_000707 [Meristemomyces frigidus]|nr:hypothetical protein LTR85_000707 [Meristemomyces frigidus]
MVDADTRQHTEQWLSSKLQDWSPKDAAREVVQLAFSDNPMRSLFWATLREADIDGSSSPERRTKPSSSAKRGLKIFTHGFGHYFHAPSAVPRSEPSVANVVVSKVLPSSHTVVPAADVFLQQSVSDAKGIDFSEKLMNVSTRTSDDTVSTSGGGCCLPKRTPAAKRSTAQVYHCLFCETSFSHKSGRGNCKRHMRDVHVAPNVWHCTCGRQFATDSDYQQHMLERPSPKCRFGANLAESMGCSMKSPLQRKVYACEFTGACFGPEQPKPLSLYLEHLVKLSETEKVSRAPGRKHTKLRAMLGHPGLLEVVRETSALHFGNPEAWVLVRWYDNDVIRKAITDLELGVVEFVPRSDERARRAKIRDYLTPLFEAGRLPGASSASQAPPTKSTGSAEVRYERMSDHDQIGDYSLPTASNAQAQHIRTREANDVGSTEYMPAMPPNTPQPLLPDPRGKRPRSHESGSIVSSHRPVGPGALAADRSRIMPQGLSTADELGPAYGLPLRQQDQQSSLSGHQAQPAPQAPCRLAQPWLTPSQGFENVPWMPEHQGSHLATQPVNLRPDQNLLPKLHFFADDLMSIPAGDYHASNAQVMPENSPYGTYWPEDEQHVSGPNAPLSTAQPAYGTFF